MIVHSYYYGPVGNGGLDLRTTRNLSKIVNEDIVQKLYTMDAHPQKSVSFSKIYQTINGPVIGITRIEPAQASDKRVTLINKTWFIRVEEIVNDLSKVLNSYFLVEEVEPIELTITFNPESANSRS